MVSAVGGASSVNFQALQQTQRITPQERFASSDADGSGGLSLEEFSSFAPDFIEDIESSFTQIDSDGDGSLTETELEAYAESQGLRGDRPPPPPRGSESSVAEEEQISLVDALLSEYTSEEQATINEFFSALLSVQEGFLAT